MKTLIVFIVLIISNASAPQLFSSEKKMTGYHRMTRPSQIQSDVTLIRPSHIFSRGIYKPRIFPTY